MSDIERQGVVELAELCGLNWFWLSPPGRYVFYVPSARYDEFPRLAEAANASPGILIWATSAEGIGVVAPWQLFEEPQANPVGE